MNPYSFLETSEEDFWLNTKFSKLKIAQHVRYKVGWTYKESSGVKIKEHQIVLHTGHFDPSGGEVPLSILDTSFTLGREIAISLRISLAVLRLMQITI